MTSFQSFLMGYSPGGIPEMELTHCTSGGSCIDIMAELVIRPTHCSVYETDLLYLFYGRPAFKPGAELGASTLAETAPVCLVLDPAVLAHAVRILPFDSGGFARYKPLLGPSLKLSQFELSADPETPRRLVKAFYETNRQYFVQSHRAGLDIQPSHRAAAGFSRLIADPAIADDDDRRSTFEIQLATEVSLKAALRALIAPAVLIDDPAIRAALAECPGAVPMDYRTFGRMAPVSLSYAIYDHLERLFEAKGVFA